MFLSAALCSLCVLLLSCGAAPGGSLTASPGSPSGTGPAELPQLSLLPEPRLASASDVLVAQPLAASFTQRAESDSLTVSSPPAGLAWALWGWYGFSEADCPQSLSLELGEIEGEYWLALPDFTRRSWKFAGPYSSESCSIEIAGISPDCLGSGGTFYIALLCHDGSACRLDSIVPTSAAAELPEKPQPWLTASLDLSPQFIQLSWPQQLQDGQAIYRLAADEPESSAVPISTEREETVTWDDSAAYAKHYYYRICAESGGQRIALSPRALGRRSLPPAGSSIAGRVAFDAYSPAPGVEVCLAELNLYSSTDSSGRYRFSGLPDGSYNLWCMKSDPPQHIGLIQLMGIDCSAEELRLPLAGTPRPDWYWLYPPLDPQVEALADDSLRLSWSPARYATGYRVYRSRFENLADLRLVAETDACSVELSGEPGGDNYYCLRSIEEDGEYFRISEPGPGAHFHAEPLGLAPDSIYAVAEQTEVERGSEVLITVYARETAGALRNLNMLRLSFETGNRYVKDSFNIGAPGGLAYHPDGVWTAAVAPDGFLSTPDSFMQESDLGTGRSCIDFNITPLLGSQVIEGASGALFNFRLKINRDTNISFIRSDTIARTFYTGLDDEPRHWENDLNEGQPPILINQ